MVKLQRVQNSKLWHNYASNRQACLHEKYAKGWLAGDIRMNAQSFGTGPVLEHSMWHGTRGTNPCDVAGSEFGWCVSHARHGSLGRGSYFADDAQYSLHGYAWRSVDNEHGPVLTIILADVLAGVCLPGQCCQPWDPLSGCVCSLWYCMLDCCVNVAGNIASAHCAPCCPLHRS